MTSFGNFGEHKFDAAAMAKYAGPEVNARFQQSLIDGTPTSDADAKLIEKALFEFCESHGCTNYAHW
jgi:hypothetical protein